MTQDRDSINVFLYDDMNMAGLFCESEQRTQELIRIQKLNLFMLYSIFCSSDERRQQWLPDGKLSGPDYRIEVSKNSHDLHYEACHNGSKIFRFDDNRKKFGITQDLLLLWQKLNPDGSLEQLADKLNIPKDPFETIPGFQMTTCALSTVGGEVFLQLSRVGRDILPVTTHKLYCLKTPQAQPMELYSLIPPISTGIPAFLHKAMLEVQDEAPVILSDCPRLVYRSSNPLHKAYLYTLTTFWGGDFAIDRLDWSCFRGRRVYCLLFKHSGRTVEQTLNTAHKILQKLQEAEIQEIQFISYLSEQDFLSFKNDFVCGNFQFWDKSKFMTLYDEYRTWQQKLKDAHLKVQRKSASYQSVPQGFLLFPLLPVGGMVAIDGGPQSYKTDVALSLAFAVAFNKKIFGRYETGRNGTISGDVLYLSGDTSPSAMPTKLTWLIRRHVDEKFSEDSLFAYFPIGFQPFPKDKFESLHGPNNIYFNAVSAKQTWTPEGFFWYLRSALQKHDEQGRRISLLVLDGFLILQKYLCPGNVQLLIQFQQGLRAYGVAMIVVFPKPLTTAQERALKTLPLSGRLQTERLQVIEKGTPAVLIHPDYYSCHNPEQGGSFFFCLNTPEAYYSHRLSRKQQAKRIKELHQMHYTGPEIAKCLNMKLSLVKKIKTELKLSQRRTPASEPMFDVKKTWKKLGWDKNITAGASGEAPAKEQPTPPK